MGAASINALDELMPHDASADGSLTDRLWQPTPEAAEPSARAAAEAAAGSDTDADPTLSSLRRTIAAEKERIFVDERPQGSSTAPCAAEWHGP
jgi:hypothetical protein